MKNQNSFLDSRIAASTTWNSPEILSSQSNGTSRNPASVVDGTGCVHVAWVDNSGLNGSGNDNDIYYKSFNTSTGTWSETEIATANNTGNSDCPAIAVDARRNIHLVWQDNMNYSNSGTDYDIFYKVRNATTGCWGPAEVISTESTRDSTDPSITVDAIGNAYVAWSDLTNFGGDNDDADDIFYKWRNVTTGAWSTVMIVTSNYTYQCLNPNIFLDIFGVLHLVYVEFQPGMGWPICGYMVTYRSKPVLSSIWSSKMVIAGKSAADVYYAILNPTIHVDKYGNKHVTFIEHSAIPGVFPPPLGDWCYAYYKRFNNASKTWESTTCLTNVDVWEGPTLTIVDDMVIHVAWQENDTLVQRWMNQSAPSRTWSNKEVIVAMPSSNPVLVSTKSLDLHAFWDNTGHVYHVMKAGINSTRPIAAFTVNSTKVEPGQSIRFNFTGNPGIEPATFQWNFGDGSSNSTSKNPVHVYNATGIYTPRLTVIDNIGKISTVSKLNFIVVANDIPPVANFTCSPNPVSVRTAIQFMDQSRDPDGSIVSRQWNFGDGSANATSQNPIHAYNSSGKYTATFMVIDDQGKYSTMIKLVFVMIPPNLPPVVNFTRSRATVSTNQVIQFTDTSTDPDGVIVAWTWNFGDGITNITTRNPVHAYNTQGKYTVTLIAYDNAGARGMMKWIDCITVTRPNQPPIANFTCSATMVKTNQQIQFTDVSIDPDGTIVSWIWNFCDGSGDIRLQHPVHAFSSPGMYTVLHAAQDNNGTWSIVTKINYIAVTPANKPPVANFTCSASTILVNQPLQFTDTSTDPDGVVVSWAWNFGDGTGNVTLQHPVHVYTTPGIYTVLLAIQDNDGTWNVIAMFNYITVLPANQPPTANFTCSETTASTGQMLQFTDTSTDPDGVVISWAWNFGDGTRNITLQHPVHVYNTPGMYSILLAIQDNDGTWNAIARFNYITVLPANQLPRADFTCTPTIARVNQQIQFNDTSMDLDGSIASWTWNFGDGSINAATQNPIHAFNTPGTFTITLVITDDDGASNHVQMNVTIIRPAMNVQSITAWYVKNGSCIDVYTKITIKDWNGDALDGVSVTIGLMFPNGSRAMLVGETGADGAVELVKARVVGKEGMYKIAIVAISKPGWDLDMSHAFPDAEIDFLADKTGGNVIIWVMLPGLCVAAAIVIRVNAKARRKVPDNL